MNFSVRNFCFLLWWGYFGCVHYDSGEGRKAASRECEEMTFITWKSKWDPSVYVGGGSPRDFIEETKEDLDLFRNENYFQRMIKAITWILIAASGSS